MPSGVQEATFKHCKRCDRDLPGSPEFFYVVKGRLDWWCKQCRRDHSKEQRRYRATIEAKAEHDREYQRQWKRRDRIEHPEKYKAIRERAYQRLKADPVAYAKYLEDSRIYYKLRQERAGRDIDSMGTQSTVELLPQVDEIVSVVPILDLLKEVVTLRGGVESAAGYLNISTKTLYRVLSEEAPTIALSSADRVLTALRLPLAAYYPLDTDRP